MAKETKKKEKTRLDTLLVDRGLAENRTRAQALILAGLVWSENTRLDKAGHTLAIDTPLEVKSEANPFSSRAGGKLDFALEVFQISPDGRVCMDVGASTGGFTDCLLQRGASHVFAVDVGYGQLDQKLRGDARVTNLERTNARMLRYADLKEQNPLAERIELVVMDVSFISLKLIVPNIKEQFGQVQDWIFLFKPQFEVGRRDVGKGGLVRNETAIKDALDSFNEFLAVHGLHRAHGPETSPLPGKKSGNVELLLHYVPSA